MAHLAAFGLQQRSFFRDGHGLGGSTDLELDVLPGVGGNLDREVLAHILFEAGDRHAHLVPANRQGDHIVSRSRRTALINRTCALILDLNTGTGNHSSRRVGDCARDSTSIRLSQRGHCQQA